METIAIGLNIIDLYRILAENPNGFVKVLKNLYGREVLNLKKSVEKTANFIQLEDGKECSRDGFIESELNDLATKFENATMLAAFFRFVVLARHTDGADSGPDYTSDSLVDDLMEIKILITIEAINFRENIHRERIRLSKESTECVINRFEDDTAGRTIFLNWKDEVLKKLENIINLVLEIDAVLSK